MNDLLRFVHHDPFIPRMPLGAAACHASAWPVRMLGLGAFHLNCPVVILQSALFRTVAFALFVVVYAPILWVPRADGRLGQFNKIGD